MLRIGAAFRHRLAAVSAWGPYAHRLHGCARSPPRLVPFHNAQAVEDYARAETYGKKSPPLCGVGAPKEDVDRLAQAQAAALFWGRVSAEKTKQSVAASTSALRSTFM